jgi:hypothetical protein
VTIRLELAARTADYHTLLQVKLAGQDAPLGLLAADFHHDIPLLEQVDRFGGHSTGLQLLAQGCRGFTDENHHGLVGPCRFRQGAGVVGPDRRCCRHGLISCGDATAEQSRQSQRCRRHVCFLRVRTILDHPPPPQQRETPFLYENGRDRHEKNDNCGYICPFSSPDRRHPKPEVAEVIRF